jgi:hypothetical protein
VVVSTEQGTFMVQFHADWGRPNQQTLFKVITTGTPTRPLRWPGVQGQLL